MATELGMATLNGVATFTPNIDATASLAATATFDVSVVTFASANLTANATVNNLAGPNATLLGFATFSPNVDATASLTATASLSIQGGIPVPMDPETLTGEARLYGWPSRFNTSGIIDWTGTATVVTGASDITILTGEATLLAIAQSNTVMDPLSLCGSASMRYLEIISLGHTIPISSNPAPNVDIQFPLTDTLAITQVLNRVIPMSVSNIVAAASDFPDQLDSQITVTGLLAGEGSKLLTSDIVTGYTILSNITLNRSLTDTISMDGGVAGLGYRDGEPIVACADPCPVDLTVSLDGIDDAEMPASINLGVPKLGNSIILDLKTLNESSRGGDPIDGVGFGISSETIYEYSFEVNDDKKVEISQFLLDNLAISIILNVEGSPIGPGIILSSADPFTELTPSQVEPGCVAGSNGQLRRWEVTLSIMLS